MGDEPTIRDVLDALEALERRLDARLDRIDPTPRVVRSRLGLTPAETRIAMMLAEGYTSRDIARETNRAYSTVRTHVKGLFGKLGVRRQFDVARIVRELSEPPTTAA